METRIDEPIWKRLLQLANRSGNVARLAELTGISYTTLKGAIDTRRGITADNAAKIVETTRCSALWLLTGKGSMFAPASAAMGEAKIAESEPRYGFPGEVTITLPSDVKAGQTIVARIVAVEETKPASK